MQGLSETTDADMLYAMGYVPGQFSGTWWYGAYVISTVEVMKRLAGLAAESATETGILAEAWD